MSDMTASRVDLEELRQTVADVIDVELAEMTNDAHFVEDLEVDSLMALEVMVVLEKRYQVKLHESELKDIMSLRKAHELLTRKLSDVST